MYRKVSTDMNFVEREKEVLDFWKREGIMEKSFHHRDGAERFTFFDGPPTANGKPAHRPHRDPRHQGPDPALPDHEGQGRPAQGRLGYPRPARGAGGGKAAGPGRQAADRGIRHRALHRRSAKRASGSIKHEWEEMSDRVGFWADMEDPYVTYEDDYIESEWWSLKADLRKGPALQGLQGRALLPPLRHRALQPRGRAGLQGGQGDVSAIVRFKVEGRGEYLSPRLDHHALDAAQQRGPVRQRRMRTTAAFQLDGADLHPGARRCCTPSLARRRMRARCSRPCKGAELVRHGVRAAVSLRGHHAIPRKGAGMWSATTMSP